MNTSSQHDTLFLHGGPGFNAHVERKVLSEQCPNVHFWDQPRVHTEGNAFSLLLDAVVGEVEGMARQLHGPIKLMANSFGVHLVSGVLERIPRMVSSCHIFGAVYDPPAAFLNLLAVMAKAAGTDRDQSDRIQGFLSAQGSRAADKNKIWEYLELITRDVNFMRHYWPSERQYAAWSDWSRTGPEFDFATLQNVMNDFLQNHYDRGIAYAGPQAILVELGDRDPLLDLEIETQHWSRRFPKAQIIIRRGSGHYIHLEPCL